MRKKRRLVYYIWIPENMTDGQERLLRLHFYCIRKNAYIFDNATIILSLDNINDIESIKKYKNEIISWGIKGDINIKVVKNDSEKREGYFFKTEIIDKLKDRDEITFFAHTKGLSNVKSGTYEGTNVNIDSIYKWVIYMYFVNLCMYDYVSKMFFGRDYISYGGLLYNDKTIMNRYCWVYSGSFFWINNFRLYDYLNINRIYIPLNNYRTYAENFLGEVVPFDFKYINSFDWRYFTDLDPYQNMNGAINFSFKDSKYYDEFFKFIEEIKEKKLYNEQ